MGSLYLVRHAQASLGAADYDELSARGRLQAQRLGAWWQAHGQRFDAVWSGTLRRHAQTLECMGLALNGLPAAQHFAALDEYDGAALVRAVHPGPLPAVHSPEGFRSYFRLLCDALAQWMAGTLSPEGMPDWQTFSAGVRALLEQARAQHAGQRLLVLSSGGPISTAIAQVLGSAPEVGIALNMRLRNTAVSELGVSARRLALQTFNTLPHLTAPEDVALQTYA
ncbi:histidine phosphatase family protein [Comamonas sp. NLF-1-9]|uniref:histidine phosphatase family protein n=1 Tax=Comamonas sp. NLF-1-9 TaxID=2853163 RepID=UPI001C481572|nr:histidine phosphatase family protein [Comamonas sp. NLF-1-9]QXL84252.1 histidine phosphatase family protein [Comamonas sp. NLF-1-9]